MIKSTHWIRCFTIFRRESLCRAQIYVFGWYYNLKLYSQNSDIATISKDGIIRARKKGKATLIAKDTQTGTTAKCKVTVTKKLTQEQIQNKLYKVKFYHCCGR